MPTFRHGKGSYFSLTSATGGTINFSSGLDEVTLSRSVKTADVTHFGQSDMNYIPGLRDAKITCKGHWASTYESKLVGLLGWSTLPTWTLGPETTADHSRKETGVCILTDYVIGAPVGDKVSMSFNLQCSGTITATTF